MCAGAAPGQIVRGAKQLQGSRGRAPCGVRAFPPETDAFLMLKLSKKPLKSIILLLKMTEMLILITLLHENTPYFFIFPFLKPLGSSSPCGIAPVCTHSGSTSITFWGGKKKF